MESGIHILGSLCALMIAKCADFGKESGLVDESRLGVFADFHRLSRGARNDVLADLCVIRDHGDRGLSDRGSSGTRR